MEKQVFSNSQLFWFKTNILREMEDIKKALKEEQEKNLQLQEDLNNFIEVMTKYKEEQARQLTYIKVVLSLSIIALILVGVLK